MACATLLLVVPQKRFPPWAIVANPQNLTVLAGSGCAPPCPAQVLADPGETRHQPGIRAKANELESLLLAVEVKPTNSSPLSLPLPAYNRQT